MLPERSGNILSSDHSNDNNNSMERVERRYASVDGGGGVDDDTDVQDIIVPVPSGDQPHHQGDAGNIAGEEGKGQKGVDWKKVAVACESAFNACKSIYNVVTHIKRVIQEHKERKKAQAQERESWAEVIFRMDEHERELQSRRGDMERAEGSGKGGT
jgi:hypothetical protein